MPNWTYNKLTASDEVLKQIVDENGEIDFNTIISMPKELEGTVGLTEIAPKRKKMHQKS